MKILLHAVVLAAVAMPAAAQQDSLRDYLRSLGGQKLVLRHKGAQATAQIPENDLGTLQGGCDTAVAVTGVSVDDTSLQLRLKNLGKPMVGNQDPPCEGARPPEYTLSITQFDIHESVDDAKLSISQILQTPRQYLASHGIAFSYPPAPPDEVPIDATTAVKYPMPLLSIVPFVSASLPKNTTGTFKVQFVVGTDGLIHRPIVLEKSLTKDFDKAFLAVVDFWCFEPGQKDNQVRAVKTHFELSFTLR